MTDDSLEKYIDYETLRRRVVLAMFQYDQELFHLQKTHPRVTIHISKLVMESINNIIGLDLYGTFQDIVHTTITN